MLVIAKDQKIIETFVKIIITLRVVGCFIQQNRQMEGVEHIIGFIKAQQRKRERETFLYSFK